MTRDENLILCFEVVNWRCSSVHDYQPMKGNAFGLLATLSDVTLVELAVAKDVAISNLEAVHNEEIVEVVVDVLEASSGAKVVC